VLGDPDFTILDANPWAIEVYGYDKAALIGKPFRELAPENTPEDFAAGQDQGETPGLIYYPKTLHFRRGRKPFYVNLHACSISYKSRPAIIVATIDITEMIEKDAQFIQASKMGSDYLALMVEQGREIPDRWSRRWGSRLNVRRRSSTPCVLSAARRI